MIYSKLSRGLSQRIEGNAINTEEIQSRAGHMILLLIPIHI